MRLQEVYYRCKEAIEHWPESPFDARKQADGKSIYCMDNFSSLNAFLSNLEKVPSLAETINKIRKLNGGLKRESNEVTLQQGEYNVFSQHFSVLKADITSTCNLCESLDLHTREDGFDIKLPSNLTLSELAACVKDLDTVFSQCPILNQNGDKITLSNIDIGSIWLGFATICSGTVFLLNRLAALVDKAVVIRSHILTCKQQEEIVKQMQMKSDILKSMVDLHNKVTAQLTENAMTELATEYGVDRNEDKERIRLSLNILGDWMSKGLEIYASIDTPDEVKAAFPTVQQQKLSTETIKMLTETPEIVE